MDPVPDEFRNTQKTAQTYNSIAERYRNMKAMPLARYLVEPTLMRLIGDVEGLDTIDLACGEGQWTRKLKHLGAATATGIDISEEMIRLAEAAEHIEPLGCKYCVKDVALLELTAKYDLAVGAFFLNYASSSKQLLAFCRATARLLRPNGRFVGINTNMSLDVSAYDSWRDIGRWMTTTPERRDGDPLTVHLVQEVGSAVSFDNYYLSPSIYEDAFAQAGFSTFQWTQPILSKEALGVHTVEFWDQILKHPQVIGFEAAVNSTSALKFKY